MSIGLWIGFDISTAGVQFVERASSVQAFAVYYHLGVDGISMPLIVLTTFITIFVIVAGWEVITYKPSHYMAAFLIMEGVMVGVFSSLDAILFYVFWEAMLIPMFIIIGVWGGPNRVYATIKFFLYTFFGSVFMLVALIYMYFQADSFSILDFHGLQLGMTAQTLIFIAFLLAFAVKVPMFPVHTWLPDAHVEAPTGSNTFLPVARCGILFPGGRFHVRIRQPGMHREHRHLDREGEQEGNEDQGLSGHAQLQPMEVQDAEAVGLEVHVDQCDQHEHRAEEGVEEELDGGVDPVRPTSTR